jgi:hypothetical protein
LDWEANCWRLWGGQVWPKEEKVWPRHVGHLQLSRTISWWHDRASSHNMGLLCLLHFNLEAQVGEKQISCSQTLSLWRQCSCQHFVHGYALKITYSFYQSQVRTLFWKKNIVCLCLSPFEVIHRFRSTLNAHLEYQHWMHIWNICSSLGDS